MDQPAASGTLPPKGISDIITAAFDVYKVHWQRLIAIAAILGAAMILAIGVIVALLIADVSTKSVWAIALGIPLGLVLIVMAGFVVQGAITRGAAVATIGDPGVDEAFKWGMKHVGSYLWIAVLVGILVGFGPLLVVLLLTLILKGTGFILGMLILIPAVVFLGTMFSVTLPALVIENRKGTDALQRSWDLVRGHFWHVLGAFVVGGILTSVVGGIIGMIFGAFGDIGSAIGQALSACVTLPFSALVAVIIYLDIRTRTENVTVEQIQSDLAKGA